MKTLPRLFAMGLGLGASALCAQAADIEWRAVLSMGGSRSYSLASKDGQERAWVSDGESFLGYSVKGVDEAGKVLTVVKDGKEEQIQLADATITDAPAAKDALAQAEELMRTMKFNELIEKMVAQQKEAMKRMTRGMTAQMGGRVPTAEQEALQERIQDLMMNELFGGDFAKDVAGIYAKVLSPEELSGLTNFFSTNAGRGFIEKQPDLMENMMQLMQPRMMAAMPKIQAVIAESGAMPTPPSAPPPPPPSAPGGN